MKKMFLTTLLVFFGATLFAQERIAVFPFEDLDNILSRNEAIMFYREFSNEFTNKSAGKFSVVPRQDVEKLINTEAFFQLSDFSAREKTAEMNRVLNGTQILSGVIGKVGSRLTITVSLYSYPELVQQPGGTSLRVANIDELFDKIPELVQSMQKEITAIANKQPVEIINKIYRIGDIGPAGGIIFYDKGAFFDGWRYLEAAPVDFPNNVQWGTALDVSTEIGIGDGRRNTELIIHRLHQLGESVRAAQLCAQLEFGGYKDWFLPSLNELELMYENLKSRGLGNFSKICYWSSSIHLSGDKPPAPMGVFILVDGRRVGEVNNNFYYSVRAIRAF